MVLSSAPIGAIFTYSRTMQKKLVRKKPSSILGPFIKTDEWTARARGLVPGKPF